ncbi:DJ-1/PfpI family protein [Acidithiobacillus sp. YTS05]|uniref:DJ-1/PfpI family protein n=2 Tax=Acidithiobacillus caldus TaxID=33059 RepID=UPI001C06EDCB|nr:DJ-1/PfpI family protein [Acidithiobacillus caldus]MBU2791661.1 DJ-1/PfpI family protein [Acidithiobacillus caldus]UTV80995.1 DJ-1/PfpI family protein [Acidithiobacillus sp. YTS05]
MTITVDFLVFPGIQLLDLAGPYEVFASLPNCEVRLCWKNREPVVCSTGMTLHPNANLGDVRPVDVLCIPGGAGINALLLDDEIVNWVRQQASAARWITSVCTGALLLGTAGLLAGRRATTHWRYHDLLPSFDAIAVRERVVQDENLITGGGVTAGIDFALTTVAALRGQPAAEAIQLALEYAPSPPFQAGQPEQAPESVLHVVESRTHALYEDRAQILRRWRHGQDNLWRSRREKGVKG